MFAIDGCKIKSNASKAYSGTFDELTRKEEKLRKASQRILARHQAQDSLSDDEVNTQWQMYCLVHNIEKLRNHLH
jgi:ribosomal protein S15P/S13E